MTITLSWIKFVACFFVGIIGLAVIVAVKGPSTILDLVDSPVRLHRDYHYWSNSCPSPEFFLDGEGGYASCCCSILDYGAIGDNSTLNTIPIQSAINTCHELCAEEGPDQQGDDFSVIIHVPEGRFKTGSLSLRSNLRLHLAKGASLYGSDRMIDYPIVPMVPNGYETHKNAMFQALLGGNNLVNVAITGENDGYARDAFATFGNTKNYNGRLHPEDSTVSVIDGVGWKWWCLYRSMPIPQDYCNGFNPHNNSIDDTVFRPKLIEFVNCSNIVLDRFLARNSPVWFIHPFLSRNIQMTNLTVLAPREVGNTDGLDPDSSQNVLMDSCYIDVGDDGVSIKSTNHSGIMVPTRNVTMRNLRIVSRNWCIGSATFGGIYEILFEDSTIGDPNEVTSPWAIKFKSHRNYPGPMENVTIRNIEMGRIGPTPWMYPKNVGSALILGLSYGESPALHPSGKPLLKNLTIENITVASAGIAGQLMGFPEDCLQGLTLRNVSVRGGTATWICEYVDLESLTVSNVYPPLTCTGGCNSSRNEQPESFDTSTRIGGDITLFCS